MRRPVAAEQAPPPASRRSARRPRDGSSTSPSSATSARRRRSSRCRASSGGWPASPRSSCSTSPGSRSASTPRSSCAIVYGNDATCGECSGRSRPTGFRSSRSMTVLVFWQAGLYAERERRAGFGRIVWPLALVGVLTLTFAIGTGHRVQDLRVLPDGARPQCDVHWPAARELRRRLGRPAQARRRPPARRSSSARREPRTASQRARLAPRRHRLRLPRRDLDLRGHGGPDPALGTFLDLATDPRTRDVDELIVTDRASTTGAVEIAEAAHRRGVKVRVAPKTTELLIQRRGEYIPGQGVPLFELRPPILVGADWLVKRSFDLSRARSSLIIGLPRLARDRGGDQAQSSRAGLLPRPPRRPQRAGSSTCSSSGRCARRRRQQAELEEENEAEGPLFKIRDDPRVTRVGRCSAASRWTRSAAAERAPRRDEPRRAAPAAVSATTSARAVAPQARPRAARHDRALADRRPLVPRLRRSRPARLLLPRALVALARHLDPAQVRAAGASTAGSVFSRIEMSSQIDQCSR